MKAKLDPTSNHVQEFVREDLQNSVIEVTKMFDTGYISAEGVGKHGGRICFRAWHFEGFSICEESIPATKGKECWCGAKVCKTVHATWCDLYESF